VRPEAIERTGCQGKSSTDTDIRNTKGEVVFSDTDEKKNGSKCQGRMSGKRNHLVQQMQGVFLTDRGEEEALKTAEESPELVGGEFPKREKKR